MTTGIMVAIGPGHIAHAVSGAVVNYASPSGCKIKVSYDLQSWEDVVRTSPFIHTGPAAHYRIDYEQYDGTNKVVTLTITPPNES